MISIIIMSFTGCNKDDENKNTDNEGNSTHKIILGTRVVVSHIDYLATIEGCIFVPEDDPIAFEGNPIARVELYAGSSEASLSLISERTDFVFTSTNTIFSVRKSFPKGTYYARARMILEDKTVIDGNLTQFVIEKEGEEPLPTASLDGMWLTLEKGEVRTITCYPDYHEVINIPDDDEPTPFWIHGSIVTGFTEDDSDTKLTVVGDDITIEFTVSGNQLSQNYVFKGKFNTAKDKITGTMNMSGKSSPTCDIMVTAKWEAMKKQ